MKKEKLQQGFGAIEVVLIVVILGILAFVGWRVYDMQKTTDTANQNATQSSTPSPENTKKPDPNEGYVVITDWGVRFKPQQGLQDVRYYKSDNGEKAFPGQDVQVFAMTTAKVESMGGSCANTHEYFTALVHIYRSKKELQAVGFPTDPQKIGDYYYYAEPAQSACGDKQENYQEQIDALNLMKLSVKTLELAK